MMIRGQLSQQSKHSIVDDENGNEYANDASQDQNARDEKPIDEKNVTKRQYSAEEHERSTKQNDESRWIKFKRKHRPLLGEGA